MRKIISIGFLGTMILQGASIDVCGRDRNEVLPAAAQTRPSGASVDEAKEAPMQPAEARAAGLGRGRVDATQTRFVNPESGGKAWGNGNRVSSDGQTLRVQSGKVWYQGPSGGLNLNAKDPAGTGQTVKGLLEQSAKSGNKDAAALLDSMQGGSVSGFSQAFVAMDFANGKVEVISLRNRDENGLSANLAPSATKGGRGGLASVPVNREPSATTGQAVLPGGQVMTPEGLGGTTSNSPIGISVSQAGDTAATIAVEIPAAAAGVLKLDPSRETIRVNVGGKEVGLKRADSNSNNGISRYVSQPSPTLLSLVGKKIEQIDVNVNDQMTWRTFK